MFFYEISTFSVVFIVTLHKDCKRNIDLPLRILNLRVNSYGHFGVFWCLCILQVKVLFILSAVDQILILANVLQPLNGIY